MTDPLEQAIKRGQERMASPLIVGMLEILRLLAQHDEKMQAIFFVSPNSYLEGDTPVSRLAQGDVTAVLRAARAYGEQGCP